MKIMNAYPLRKKRTMGLMKTQNDMLLSFIIMILPNYIISNYHPGVSLYHFLIILILGNSPHGLPGRLGGRLPGSGDPKTQDREVGG